MATACRRDPAKEFRWRDHFERWRASGLSAAEYCRQNNLKYRDFSNWRRIIADRELEQSISIAPVEKKKQSASRQERVRGKAERARLRSIEFAPVRVVDSMPPDHQLPMETANAVVMEVRTGKLAVSIKNGCTKELLASLISALENH